MASGPKSRRSGKRQQDGDGASKNKGGGDSQGKPGNKKTKPDFSKPDHTGEIPDPVEKWLRKLGKSVPENEAFTLDGSGKEFDVEDIEDACGETFYVVYRYTELIDKACEGLNFAAFVKRGEGKARKDAQDIADACNEDGCVAGIVVEYESWLCNAVKTGGSRVNVEIALKVECVEI